MVGIHWQGDQFTARFLQNRRLCQTGRGSHLGANPHVAGGTAAKGWPSSSIPRTIFARPSGAVRAFLWGVLISEVRVHRVATTALAFSKGE